MSKRLNIELLRNHLFETLEGVKNLTDEEASPCEKISIEQAKQIVDISGKIIDTYKVQLDALNLAAKMDGMNRPGAVMQEFGVITEEQRLQIEG